MSILILIVGEHSVIIKVLFEKLLDEKIKCFNP